MLLPCDEKAWLMTHKVLSAGVSDDDRFLQPHRVTPGPNRKILSMRSRIKSDFMVRESEGSAERQSSISASSSFDVDYDAVLRRLREVRHRKLGYPESLLGSLQTETGDKHWIDFAPLGIMPGSLADQLIANVGDPFVDSTSFSLEIKDVERAVIRRLGAFFGLPDGDAAGYVTSGGTEANLAALWWHRRALVHAIAMPPAIQGAPGTAHLALVLTADSSHYSLMKIAELLGLQVIAIPPRQLGHMDTAALRRALRELGDRHEWLGLIVSANLGSCFHGAFDPVLEIKQLLKELSADRSQFLIHGDGALMGMTMPFTRPFGSEVEHSMTEMGLDSLSISAHKWLGCPLVSGVVLTSRALLNRAFPKEREVDYAGSVHDITVTGCRPGLAPLQIYASLKSLSVGEADGGVMPLLVERCRSRVEWLYDELAIIHPPGDVHYTPPSFQIRFPCPSPTLVSKFQLMPRRNEAVVHLLENVNDEVLREFLCDLRAERAVPTAALAEPHRSLVRRQRRLAVEKGIHVRVLSDSDIEPAARLLSMSFAASEPTTVHLRISEEEFFSYARSVCEATVKEALSLVIHNASDELLGCVILSDWLSGHTPPSGLTGKLKPVLALLGSIDHYARRSVGRPWIPFGEYAHLWMTAVHPDAQGQGLASLLNTLGAVRALHAGYRWTFVQFTHPFNHRTARAFLGAEDLCTLPYSDFEFEGERPFAELEGSVIGTMLRLSM